MPEIVRFSEGHRQQVLGMSVSPEQRPFVGTTRQLLDERESGWHYHLFVDQDEVIGFFNIDTKYSERYEFTRSHELGLRAFLVDQKHQGKGYATKMLQQLPHWLQRHYPKSNSICLTVNAKNTVAKGLYLRMGFEDSGELYLGGQAGPQHILRMAL